MFTHFLFTNLWVPYAFNRPVHWVPLTDVPPALARSINHGSSQAPRCDGDVILFLKKIISDDELSQSPLLVMPESRSANFTFVPTTKIFVTIFYVFFLVPPGLYNFGTIYLIG